MRPSTEEVIEKYKQNLFAAAFSVCRSREDAEDAVQDTFIRYHTCVKDFAGEEHIRAWLIRVAVNRAKDIARSRRIRNTVPLEEYTAAIPFESREESDLFAAVMKLDKKYRTVIHLFYYEDYKIGEIAEILGKSQGTIKSLLSRARQQLKAMLKEEWNND